eukprot:CAMPEP_0201587868 /NCGR_PEP_ID=MMETSP0190_2-20130828/148473_1 /ASSEMBLY_ACC=CAM_ASM_000263 /TAXON_ID=37353 /ORGANISM="Rosalina sp." /LENGTH=78 /DNA_ID=CAMNT_0048038793 /DNA_START=43 /DNA_END=276 /DNA_ORIENTATION=-
MTDTEPKILEEEKEEVVDDKEMEEHKEDATEQPEETEDDSNSDFEDYSLTEKRNNLIDGDYIVQVHIIEGRDLKGRGW